MKLDEIVAWYQKKIGTHDKQQWEKTVEQKILSGFSSIKLKNAKLKTELIDVDLVRGSTFPKAKPKQTLLTVIRLAILRYLFLPIYAQWWVHQTSANTFGVLLFLYVTQMINWAIYTFNMHHLTNVASNHSIVVNNNNATVSSRFTESVDPVDADEPSISVAELLIPMALSLLLSLIHSQIVATNSAGGSIKSKHRRFSNASVNGHRVPARLRRRKKLVKSRSQDNSDAGTAGINLKVASTTQRKLNSKLTSGLEALDKSVLGVPSNNYNTKDVISSQQVLVSATSATAMLATASISSEITYNDDVTKESSSSLPSNVSKPKIDLGIINDSKVSPTVIVANKTINSAIISNSFISNSSIKPSTDKLIDGNLQTINTLVKRRNVNWHSPVHNYAIEMNEKQQQTSPQATESSEPSSSYSWDGSSSSSSNSININLNTESVTKPINIDDGVQEFYDNLMDEATVTTTTAVTNARSSLVQQPAGSLNKKRIIGEDDGFESLNGKSSSGEEGLVGTRVSNNDSNFISTDKQQLRFRLKASELSETAKRLTTKVVQNAALTAAASFRHHIPLSFESDYDHMHTTNADMNFKPAIRQRSTMTKPQSTDETDEDGDDDAQTLTSPSSVRMNSSTYNECTTSATEWLGVTTNSEECSYSSELDNSDDFKKDSAAVSDEDYDGYDFTPTTILNPHGTPADRISCTIWDQRVAKKAQMSVLEISSSIIERVESMPETNDYIYIGIFFSVILSLIPSFCRLCEITINSENPNEIKYLDLPMLLWEKASCSFMTILKFAFGQTQWERSVLIIGFIQRVCLTLILFTIFAVAERTFKQRFLYGKLFSHLTSSRRARKSNLPHFRLNKVRNIKTWLSVRSYLKKRGPQRSVDVIVSAAFIVTLLLLAFLSVEWLKDSVYMHSHLNLEALMWSVAIGIFLLRFMTLGNKIHHKYRSVSVLITEQINLYLQIEQKPKKKEELMVSNSVLKLAADLLKELETPFKISGLSANPYLFTTIKVVILSALSGVLSEMLGFKLKLHKITIK